MVSLHVFLLFISVKWIARRVSVLNSHMLWNRMTGLDNIDSTVLFGCALACEHFLQMEMVLELSPLSSA